jgi:hypothetical protein
MHAGLLIVTLVPVQFMLWMIFARIIYRNWEWNEMTTEESRKIDAGIWGFVWPLLATYLIGAGVCSLIGLAMTAPSIGERREIKRAAKKERLRDLDKQIAVAEAELAATE